MYEIQVKIASQGLMKDLKAQFEPAPEEFEYEADEKKAGKNQTSGSTSLNLKQWFNRNSKPEQA